MFNYEISRKGLWFKLHKFARTANHEELYCKEETNICSWFWKGWVILGVIILTIPFLLILIYITVVNWVLVLVTGALGVFLPWLDVYDAIFFTFIVLFALVVYGGGLLADSFEGDIPWIPAYISKYLPKKIGSRYIRPTKKHQPSLISTYYSAYKAKMCFKVKVEELK